MTVLLHKLKEVSIAVAPIIALVVILAFTLAPMPSVMLVQFIVGAVLIIVGLAILLVGVDLGFLPFGENMGSAFIKSNSMIYVIIVGFILGFLINFAEPDLQVLAIQVADALNNIGLNDIIRVVVAGGTGIMLMLGIVRIVKNFKMNVMFLIIYAVAFILVIFADAEMFAIAFDASGAATGIITVPLVLAVSGGVASMRRDSRAAEEDSFGMVGMMATGAVLGVLVLNLFLGTGSGDAPEPVYAAADYGAAASSGGFLEPFVKAIIGYDGNGSRTPGAFEKTLIGMLPIVAMLFVFQWLKFRLRAKAFIRILIGLLYAFVGIVLFFIGVNGGFMEVGKVIGNQLAGHDGAVLVGMGFLLGMVGILTEPAVHVLTRQIEDVTNGYVKRRTVLATLAIGVAMAVGLSMLRVVVPQIMLWHFLLPGFAVAITLTFIVPKIFVGMAFDSGGVASGPMAATFVLSFARGAAETTYTGLTDAEIAANSFGVIAMVAMTPLIAIQVLGLIYKVKTRKARIKEANGRV